MWRWNIANATETLLNDKKVTCKKSNCLIHTISLIIIFLLLLVVLCVRCYFCYTKYRCEMLASWNGNNFFCFDKKKKLPFHDANNKIKGIDINRTT